MLNGISAWLSCSCERLCGHIANAIPRPGPKGTAIGKAYARAKDKVDAAVAAVVAHEIARSMRVGERREAMYL